MAIKYYVTAVIIDYLILLYRLPTSTCTFSN